MRKFDLVFIKGTSMRGLLRTSSGAMEISIALHCIPHSITPDEVHSIPRKLMPLIKPKQLQYTIFCSSHYIHKVTINKLNVIDCELTEKLIEESQCAANITYRHGDY